MINQKRKISESAAGAYLGQQLSGRTWTNRVTALRRPVTDLAVFRDADGWETRRPTSALASYFLFSSLSSNKRESITEEDCLVKSLKLYTGLYSFKGGQTLLRLILCGR